MRFHEGAVPRGEIEIHHAGTVILREGERGDDLYVIDEGEVQAFRDDDADFAPPRRIEDLRRRIRHDPKPHAHLASVRANL